MLERRDEIFFVYGIRDDDRLSDQHSTAGLRDGSRRHDLIRPTRKWNAWSAETRKSRRIRTNTTGRLHAEREVRRFEGKD